jgi:hypothetical protein
MLTPRTQHASHASLKSVASGPASVIPPGIDDQPIRRLSRPTGSAPAEAATPPVSDSSTTEPEGTPVPIRPQAATEREPIRSRWGSLRLRLHGHSPGRRHLYCVTFSRIPEMRL